MRRRTFTLIEIMIVVAIIGLLAAIAIPQFMKYRRDAAKNACISNLRQIDTAKQVWAMLYNKDTGDTPTWSDLLTGDIANTYLKSSPVCRVGGTYSLNPVSTTSSCSISDHVLYH